MTDNIEKHLKENWKTKMIEEKSIEKQYIRPKIVIKETAGRILWNFVVSN